MATMRLLVTLYIFEPTTNNMRVSFLEMLYKDKYKHTHREISKEICTIRCMHNIRPSVCIQRTYMVHAMQVLFYFDAAFLFLLEGGIMCAYNISPTNNCLVTFR